MSEEQIKQYYKRIEKILNGANKGTYGFAPEEIRQILKLYDYLQQENKQLKEQNEKEFSDYTKFKQEQYDEYLEKSNKLIKEKQHYKHIIDELEKWLKEEMNIYDETRKMHEEYSVPEERCNAKYHTTLKVLNKLQELKGSDKE